jgi:putative holliday junction resolvase
MTPAQVILAFDFGLRRIGIACGDTLTKAAAPRAAVTVGGSGPDWEAIARQVRAVAPGQLVVGAPYNADGSDSALTRAARGFAAELARRFALPVHLVDERYSSLEAGAALKSQRASGQRRRRVRRADVDSAAAAVILGRFLRGEGNRIHD